MSGPEQDVDQEQARLLEEERGRERIRQAAEPDPAQLRWIADWGPPGGARVEVAFIEEPDTGRLLPVKVVFTNRLGIRGSDVHGFSLSNYTRQANSPVLRSLLWGEPADDDDVVDLGLLRRPGEYTGATPSEQRTAHLRHVARRYAQEAVGSHRPAVMLAAEADVPVTTVHRWIREARRAGLLPPARPGAAG